jgi:hypothetical protein
MDALSRTPRNMISLFASPLLAAILATPGNCLAGGAAACHCRVSPSVDGCTRCEWHRTWHGPNALTMPLSRYFIPRHAPGCDCYGCTAGCGEAVAECPAWAAACDYEEAVECCPAAVGLEPAGLERLGQIPNDLELAVGVPGASPKRPGR